MSRSFIEIKNLNFSFHPKRRVLSDINLEIAENEVTAFIGPNGGGKSTLIKLIAGLLRPNSGSILIDGEPAKRFRSKIGYVPQHSNFNPSFPITVFDAVLMGAMNFKRFPALPSREERASANEVLDRMKLTDVAGEFVADLSGGQIQRVLIARALSSKPKLLLLDEPTSNVDPAAEINFTDWIESLSGKITVIIVTHDIGFISPHIQRVACINEKLLCHDTDKLTSGELQKLYGHAVQHVHVHAHTDDKGGGFRI